MPAPQDIDIELYEGSGYRGRFYVYESTEAARRRDQTRLKALEGYSARAQLRASLEAPAPVVAEFSTDNGGAVVDASGFVDLVIPGEASQGKESTWTGLLYDLFLVTPGGEPLAVARGVVVVIPSVTQFA
jgi:hypothetical protein